MKIKLILVLMFSLAFVFISCENENQLTQSTSDSEKKELNKKPVTGELITFTGDLEGNQTVLGCCPNAGPFPEYTMNLAPTAFPGEIAGEQTGNIFMNNFGRKPSQGYIVQFWWGEEPDNVYFVEIKGGKVRYDKRTKILTATFTNEPMTIIDPNSESADVDVSFTLTRAPI